MIAQTFLIRRPGRLTSSLRNWIALTTAPVLLGLSDVFTGNALAQVAMDSPRQQDDPTIDVNRDQWRERIAEKKRRVRQFAVEHRGQLALESPMVDQERIELERVLNDDSLQRGDIVSTNKGLFVFNGRPDRERQESDFVALPSR